MFKLVALSFQMEVGGSTYEYDSVYVSSKFGTLTPSPNFLGVDLDLP